MRIAFLAYRGTMKSGGLGIYLHALTRQLAQQGFEIDLFVGPPYPDPMPWARVIRIENEHFWDRNFAGERGAPLSSPQPFRTLRPLTFFELAVTRFGFLPEPFAFSLRAARAIIHRVREGRTYDLVHDVQTLGYGVLLLQALGVPIVSTIHHPLTIDLRFSLRRDRSFMDRKGSVTLYPVRTQARVARRLQALITSSEASIGEIVAGFGVPRERIHNVGNGVDLPPAGRLRPRPAEPELLFMGRAADPNKGLDQLLAALAQLPDAVRLRVFDDPPVGTSIGLQIEQLRLARRMTFEGKVPRARLLEAIRSASLVVVPSLFEGFGLPAIEALAAGTPVLASEAGALPEVISHAGAGKLVPVGDCAALAKGISEILERWEPAQREAVKARSRIEAEFGWPRVAARTVDVYRRALGPN